MFLQLNFYLDVLDENALSPLFREPSSPRDTEPSPASQPPQEGTLPVSQPPREGTPPASHLPPAGTPPSTQPSFFPTPPCSQPTPSHSEASQTQALSHQSTVSTLRTTSSISSFSSDFSGDGDDNSQDKLCHIMSVAEEIVDRCRICWVNREVSRPHSTFCCATRICSGGNWQTFKSDLQFPRGTVCYFCLAPYGPPFNHSRAPPDT